MTAVQRAEDEEDQNIDASYLFATMHASGDPMFLKPA